MASVSGVSVIRDQPWGAVRKRMYLATLTDNDGVNVDFGVGPVYVPIDDDGSSSAATLLERLVNDEETHELRALELDGTFPKAIGYRWTTRTATLRTIFRAMLRRRADDPLVYFGAHLIASATDAQLMNILNIGQLKVDAIRVRVASILSIRDIVLNDTPDESLD